MKLIFQARVESNLKTIQSRFDRELFTALKPPLVGMNLIRFDGCKKGDEVHLETGLPGFMQKWVSVITDENETEQEWFFVDEGRVLPFPLKRWRHTHRVIRDGEGGAVIRDEIEFGCANPAIEFCMAPALWAAFSVRPGRYRRIFTIS